MTRYRFSQLKPGDKVRLYYLPHVVIHEMVYDKKNQLIGFTYIDTDDEGNKKTSRVISIDEASNIEVGSTEDGIKKIISNNKYRDNRKRKAERKRGK